MKKWKHINFEQRKTIASGIAHNMKVKTLGELLELDPTGISREVKRNRSIVELIKKIKKHVHLLKDGLMFVLIVKKDTMIVLLINLFIMLKKHKTMLTII